MGLRSVPGSPERHVGAPRFLIDLIGGHFRLRVWNIPGEQPEGTSGACCQGAGPVGLKERVVGFGLYPLPGGRDVGAQLPRDGGLS